MNKKFVFAIMPVLLVWMTLPIGIAATGTPSVKVVPLPQLAEPLTLAVHDGNIYIGEGPVISIYSLEDFQFKKKFGRGGEGPKEFKLDFGKYNLEINPGTCIPGKNRETVKCLIINSLGKVSYFTAQGEFITELRANYGDRFKPMGQHFVGRGIITEKNTRFETVFLFNGKLEKIREIHRGQSYLQTDQGKGFLAFHRPNEFLVCAGKIFVAGWDDFIIHAFNQNGETLFTINEKYPKQKVTQTHKEEIYTWFKTDPLLKKAAQRLIRQVRFPEYFPDIRHIGSDGIYIYAATFLKKDGNIEHFVFDGSGKLVKHLFLPLVMMDPNDAYPYTFAGGKLYQLVDNRDREEWELRIVTVK